MVIDDTKTTPPYDVNSIDSDPPTESRVRCQEFSDSLWRDGQRMGCGSSMPVVPGEDVPTKTVYLSVKGESKSVSVEQLAG